MKEKGSLSPQRQSPRKDAGEVEVGVSVCVCVCVQCERCVCVHQTHAGLEGPTSTPQRGSNLESGTVCITGAEERDVHV